MRSLALAEAKCVPRSRLVLGRSKVKLVFSRLFWGGEGGNK